MDIPVRTALHVVKEEVRRLQEGRGIDPAALQAMQSLLVLIDERERPRYDNTRTASLDAIWNELAINLLGRIDDEQSKLLQEFRSHLKSAANADHIFTEYMQRGETLFAKLFAHAKISNNDRSDMTRMLMCWEASQPSSAIDGGNIPAATTDPIEAEAFAAYLRERMSDPTLEVPSLRVLSGGYGKQTVLLTVTGNAMSGDFVLRYDHGAEPIFDKDCHQLQNEFEMLCLIHAAGYPAPQPFLFDGAANGLTGRPMFIMRRIEGSAGGGHVQANQDVPIDLLKQLASLSLRLHQLRDRPFLTALGTMISKDASQLSRAEAIRRDLTGWRDLFRSASHSPSMALEALYDLLLREIPPDDGPTSLLHGDLGLHNVLASEGGITGVVDWEGLHYGDPAEDVVYTLRSLGNAVDRRRFLDFYYAEGGERIDDAKLRFFELAGHARSLVACNLAGAKLASGQADVAKLWIPGDAFLRHFLNATADSLSVRHNTLLRDRL